MYEMLVGGVANLLENRPRGEVATKADIAGPVESPKTSTLQIIGQLIKNAFFKAILPGFEQEVTRLKQMTWVRSAASLSGRTDATRYGTCRNGR